MAEVIELFEDDSPEIVQFGEYSEKELVTLLSDMVNDGQDYLDAEVNPQRAESLQYYYGEPLGNEKKGRSKHISMDVFDSVEGAKAILSEAFGATNEAVKFEPSSAMTESMAKAATQYTKTVMFQDNNGYQVLRDSFHDGLLSKIAVFDVDREEEEEEIEHQIPPMPVQQLQQVVANPDVEVLSLQDLGAGLVTGVLIQRKDTSKTRVRLLPPEKFALDPEAECKETARFCFDWEDWTKSELIEQGFDPEIIEDLPPVNDDEDQTVKQARHSNDSTWTTGEQDYGEANDLYRLYRIFAYLDMDNAGTTSLYKVYMAGDRILTDPEPVDSDPYILWSSIPLSHRWMGMAQADTTKAIQKSKSVLQRLIIDNQHRVNTSRMLANTGLIKNPRELVAQHIGGVIDTTDMDAVRELPTPSLSPVTFQTVEMLDQELEGRNGVSRLAQGLNPDAVSFQNSSKVIQQLSNAGNRRIIMMARDYAETAMKPLYRRILALGIEHEKKPVPILMGGKWVPVQLSKFPKDAALGVSVALTEQERSNRAAGLLSMHTVMAQDEVIKSLYGPKQRYNLYGQVFALMGEKAFDQYLQDPDDPEFQQKMAQQAQIQQKKQQEVEATQKALVQAQLVDAQAKAQRTQVEAAKSKGALALDRGELDRKERADNVDAQSTFHDDLLADRQFEHQVWKDHAEVALEATQNRPVGL